MSIVKITILNDNTSGRKCLAEHGLSFVVETTEKILFDTGHSDVFIENANRIGVNLDEIKTVVISHGHDDHTGGLRFLSNKEIIGHPSIFMKRFRKRDNTPLGMMFSREEAVSKYGYKLRLSSSPMKIADKVWFMGEVPRLTDFESQSTQFVDENGTDDFIPDDSGMVIESRNGLIVISGCAHSGICNMIKHAKNITNVEKIYAVIGGFHLLGNDEQTSKTISFLKTEGVENVMPSHCTMFPALTEFYREFGFTQVRSGNVIEM